MANAWEAPAPEEMVFEKAAAGFTAEIFALITKFSAPDPGIHCAMTARDSSFGSTLTSPNPAPDSSSNMLLISDAPETQQANASAVFNCEGSSARTSVELIYVTEHQGVGESRSFDLSPPCLNMPISALSVEVQFPDGFTKVITGDLTIVK